MKTFLEYSRGAGSGSGVIQSADPKNKALQALMKKHNVTGKPINKSGKGLKLIGKPDDIKKVLDGYIKLEEGKAYGPTGIAYSVPKGHPDEVDPRTKKKYPDRQTAKYKKQWAKSNKEEMEEVAANSIAGGGVDMNPTGVRVKKMDGRNKYSIGKMFRRNEGTK